MPFLSLPVFAATDYWTVSSHLWVDGNKTGTDTSLYDYYKQKPCELTNVSFSMNSSYSTSQTITVNVQGRINWYNYKVQRASYWYYYNFRCFDLTYKVQYKNTLTSGSWTDFYSTSERVVVGGCGTTAGSNDNYEVHAASRNMDFSKVIDTGRALSSEGHYQFRVTVTARPANVPQSKDCSGETNYYSDADRYPSQDPSQFNYITTPYVAAYQEKTTSGFGVQITFDDGTKPFASVDVNVNPASGDRYLVYNSPDAAVSVGLSADNISKESGSVSYATFMSVLGDNSIPTQSEYFNAEVLPSSSKAGTYKASMSDDDQQFLEDAILADPVLSPCYSSGSGRFRHVLLNSANSELSAFQHNAFTMLDDLTPDANGNIIDRTYHLRDISLAARPEDNSVNTSGATFMIHPKVICYPTDMAQSTFTDKPVFRALGVGSPNPIGSVPWFSDDKQVSSTQKWMFTTNEAKYRVVGPVVFPDVQEREVSTCGKHNDHVHLQGTRVTVIPGEESLFNDNTITYCWQYTLRNTADAEWYFIDQTNAADYIVGSDSYGTDVDAETDIVLTGDFIKDKLDENMVSCVYFRQVAVLDNFKSSVADGHYKKAVQVGDKTYYAYVVEPASNVRPYKVGLYSMLSINNFEWIVGNPAEEFVSDDDHEGEVIDNNTICIRPCKGEEIMQKYMSFTLQDTRNNPITLNDLRNAAFLVYGIDKDGDVTLLGDWTGETLMEYEIEYDAAAGDSLHYRCVIKLCEDSIYKDVCIYPYPVDVLDVDKIGTSGKSSIVSTDSRTATVNMVCPKGDYAYVSLDEIITNPATGMYWRESGDASTDCGEYPAYVPTDFSNYTYQQLVDLINSKVAEGKTNWDFEATTGTTFEQASTIILRDFCAEQERVDYETDKAAWEAECMKRYDWQEFTNNSGFYTQLRPSDDTMDEVTYFVRTRTTMGCYSDSVRVVVSYVNPITDNIVGFDTECSQSSAYIVAGGDLPAAYGRLVAEGYGTPTPEETFSYIYQWQWNDTDPRNEAAWNNFDPDVTVTDSDGSLNMFTEGIMLPAGKKEALESTVWLRRKVLSRRNGNAATQITSISNTLIVSIAEDIDEDVIEVSDGFCAGKPAKVRIITDPSGNVDSRTRYEVSCDDHDTELVQTSDLGMFPDLGNVITLYPMHDVTLTITRHDGSTGSTSRAMQVPVDVMEAEASFSIVANNIEYSLEQAMSLMPGTRIELVNNSVGSDLVYKWTLQIQEFIEGMSIDGATTDVENPACYVYNAGINKIRLDVQTSTRDASGTMYCRSSVTADNIEVIDNGMYRNKFSGFVTGDGDDWQLTSVVETVSVYPTILDGASGKVTIETNKESYGVELYNVGGRLIYAESGLSGTSEIVLPFLQSGTYVLGIDGIPFKIISK